MDFRYLFMNQRLANGEMNISISIIISTRISRGPDVEDNVALPERAGAAGEEACDY